MNSPAPTPPKNSAGLIAAICLGLAAITFAVFGQTAGFQFVNLDDDLFYLNPAVAGGLSLKGLRWIFTHTDVGFYHPLTMLSFMMDRQLYKLHAGGYHVTNALLHTGSVVLLFLVLRAMTGTVWRSAFAAAVFAIHPLHVESVAWVAERKDVLSGFFFMVTLAAYAYLARRPDSWGRYWMVVGAYALDLLSKPSVVVVPLLLLVLDYWPLRRLDKPEKLPRLVLEKIPLLVLAGVITVITILATSGIKQIAPIPLPERFGDALVYYVVYLRQMIWPAALAVVYPVAPEGYSLLEMTLAGALVAGVSVVAWKQRQTRPWLLAGWLWYLGMLTPMIGIKPPGAYPVADRYTYLTQIGIYLIAAWVVAEWRIGRFAQGSLMAVVIAALAVCGWKQTTYWRNNQTLWKRALACTTGNVMAHNNLGLDYYQNGQTDEAIEHYRDALKIDPRFSAAQGNLVFALFREGRDPEALAALKLLNTMPLTADAFMHLAGTLQHKGYLTEAIEEYQGALLLEPNSAEIHNDIASALRQAGRVDEAIAHYQTALSIMPANESLHFNFAIALVQKGRMDDAIAEYEEAVRLAPNDIEALNNLAWMLATSAKTPSDNGPRALQVAQHANELSGGKNAVVLGTLAAALADCGQFDQARRTAQEAIALAQATKQDVVAGRLNRELQSYLADRPIRMHP